MANTYNYGIISGGTGSFGSIQFTSDEAGGTKEIMATGSAGPKMHNLMSVSASAALEAGASTLGSLKVSDLTSGRLVFAGANGELQDDSDLTFSSDTLTATKIGAFEAAGAINFANQDMTNVDIDSGAIDGTTIGAASAASGKFTQLSASTGVSGSEGQFGLLKMSERGDGKYGNQHMLFMDNGTVTSNGSFQIDTGGNNLIAPTGKFEAVKAGDAADLKIHFGSDTSGQNQIIMNDDFASALLIKDSNGDNFMDFDTRSGVNAKIKLLQAVSGSGAATFGGSVTAGSSFVIGNADLNEVDMEKLDGITNGTVAANKAVVVDGSKDASGFRNVTAEGSFIIGSADLNETDMEKIDGITNGTVAASKAVVVDASKDASGMRNLTGTGALSFATLTATGNASVSGSLHVVGDIDVAGNINSVTRTETTLEVVDKLVIVASGSNAAASDAAGLQFGSFNGSDNVASILYDNGNSAIDFNIAGTTQVRLEDAKLLPQANNDVDLGSSALQYKDLYIDGKAYIDQLGENLDANSKSITNASGLSGSYVSASIELGAGKATIADATLATAKVSDLTATRIVFAGANGELTDDSDLTFATDTLTATKIGAFEAAGAINFANQAMTNVDINSGAIDGTTVGASSQSSVRATTLSGSSTLTVGGAAQFNSSLTVKAGQTATLGGNLVANGNVDLGSDSSDTVSVNGLVDTDVVPSTNNARDLGSSAKQWKDLYVDGIAYIDQLGTPGDKIAAVYATNVYTGDFHMKNERGDWTLFEESDYLRIRNNKTGQEFKMDMTPISED